MERKSIKDAEKPSGLTAVQQIEFNILKSKFMELESQWFQLLNNANSDQVRYGSIVKNEYDSMIDQARELAKIRKESIKAQYEVKLQKINSEYDENKKLLFKRIVRGYYLKYQDILSHLRELLGPDFEAFLHANEYEFPLIPSNPHTERNIAQPDEMKLALSHHESEKMIHAMMKNIERSRMTTDDESPNSANQE
ncbi:hypothetical protein TRFO_41835 [Tritrichomonas foetus]|uniref:Uncharacterized protein n=1 Tax=Tritrichomonas foetus TaxID=1144522 RepID=A0A1J4L319_9EUKA|nr:hypothetical protein TRFO_41835 [Tritrichomonas foetus]|eukprot:OHT16350.1 hypothetical protein TRFO_41835 [Tritrichomonas foetus]